MTKFQATVPLECELTGLCLMPMKAGSVFTSIDLPLSTPKPLVRCLYIILPCPGERATAFIVIDAISFLESGVQVIDVLLLRKEGLPSGPLESSSKKKGKQSSGELSSLLFRGLYSEKGLLSSLLVDVPFL